MGAPSADSLTFENLNASQKKALWHLVEDIGKAAEDSNARDLRGRSSNLFFLSGPKGAGKTTLVELLRQGLASPQIPGGVAKNSSQFKALWDRAKRDELVWLDPIRLDPTPPGSNLVAAIMARLAATASAGGLDARSPSRGREVIASLDQARNELESLQAKAVTAFEGSLVERRPNTDIDSYAVSVTENERQKVNLPRRLNRILSRIASGPGSNEASGERKLYIAIIDDMDVNPERTIAALEIASLLAIPRLFFLFLGDVDLVDTVLFYRVQHSLSDIIGASAGDRKRIRTDIEDTANELASSLLRKLIPPAHQAKLKRFDFAEALAFKEVNTGAKADETVGLQALLGKNEISAPRLGMRGSSGTEGTKPTLAKIFDLDVAYGGKELFALAPRQIKALYQALAKSQKSPDRCIATLGHAFEGLVNEDPKLGVPLQRDLKEMLRELHPQYWDEREEKRQDESNKKATDEPNKKATDEPNKKATDESAFLFECRVPAGLELYAHLGVELVVDPTPVGASRGSELLWPSVELRGVQEIEIQRKEYEDEVEAAWEGLGAAKHHNSGRSVTKTHAVRKLGIHTRGAFRVLYDLCVSSSRAIPPKPLRMKNAGGIAQTVWPGETDDGAIVFEWQGFAWPTFWHPDLFIQRWNEAMSTIRRVADEASEIYDDQLALLAFAARVSCLLHVARSCMKEGELTVPMLDGLVVEPTRTTASTANPAETRGQTQADGTPQGTGEGDSNQTSPRATDTKKKWCFAPPEKSADAQNEVKNDDVKSKRNHAVERVCNHVGDAIAKVADRVRTKIKNGEQDLEADLLSKILKDIVRLFLPEAGLFSPDELESGAPNTILTSILCSEGISNRKDAFATRLAREIKLERLAFARNAAVNVRLVKHVLDKDKEDKEDRSNLGLLKDLLPSLPSKDQGTP